MLRLDSNSFSFRRPQVECTRHHVFLMLKMSRYYLLAKWQTKPLYPLSQIKNTSVRQGWKNKDYSVSAVYFWSAYHQWPQVNKGEILWKPELSSKIPFPFFVGQSLTLPHHLRVKTVRLWFALEVDGCFLVVCTERVGGRINEEIR